MNYKCNLCSFVYMWVQVSHLVLCKGLSVCVCTPGVYLQMAEV